MQQTEQGKHSHGVIALDHLLLHPLVQLVLNLKVDLQRQHQCQVPLWGKATLSNTPAAAGKGQAARTGSQLRCAYHMPEGCPPLGAAAWEAVQQPVLPQLQSLLLVQVREGGAGCPSACGPA